jgi:type II secretory pathway component GspD/PulD (secretin)
MRVPVRPFLWILAAGFFAFLAGGPAGAQEAKQDAKTDSKQESKDEAKKDSKEDTKQDSNQETKQEGHSRRRGSFRGGPYGQMPFGGMPPGGFPMMPGAGPGGMPMPGATDKPGEGGKPGDGSGTVQRPKMPLMPPRPGELMTMPDEKGKVRFNFNGQPWPAVLDWLARISHSSLDWQELPDGFLNLNTQRGYTIAEARDLINVHLLARGFTILREGELLHVVNIKKLDPSLVPRVTPAELERRDPHEFVKVSFALDWMIAETAVDEFKPMLSANGTLTALEKTNRIEARDAVVNLREIYNVLKSEQSGESKKTLVQEFVLQHARASDVQTQLQTLLDIPPKSGLPAMPQSPDQAQQQQAMMIAQMQMQQQGGHGRRGREGQPGQPPGAAAQGKASGITLVVNDRKNSILANAPPDKMAIIDQAIKIIDVPSARSQSLVGNMSRMQVYRLVGIDPEPVVKTLQQIGNLDPTTRLDIDPKSKAIIAYASLADHVTIRAVVAKLSGSERSFSVRRLRANYPADYVAGTIAYMLGVPPKKQQKERRVPWYMQSQSSSDSTSERPNEFRVDADLENNRLLLWANEIEVAEVDNLLVKLGAISPKGAKAETERTIDAGSVEDAQELLEQIRRAWPSVAPNPLQMPRAVPKKKQRETPPAERPPEDGVSQPPKSAATPRGSVFRTAAMQGEAADAPAADGDLLGPPANSGRAQRPATAEEEAPPPVKLSIDADGKIVITSDDPEALDRLQDLAAELMPPRRDYAIIHLNFVWASGVRQSLEEFFKDDNEKKQTRRRPWYWDDYDSSQTETEDDRRLSKRRKLKFISDTDTNNIIVQGADAAQLQTIKELVKEFDKPAPKGSNTTDRKTETFRLRYAKAKDVLDVIKDVYRDLLSSNDKALAAPGQREIQRTYIFDNDDTDGTGKGDQVAPKFKGLLSVGLLNSSNALVVSAAPVSLFERVAGMIRDLDDAASDNTVRVVKVGRGISAARLQDVLDSVLNEGSSRGPAGAKKPSRRTPEGAGERPGGGPQGGMRQPGEN